ncbi:MAG: hypothetical protein EZS28_011744 [Streblomastix strix]|uniref:Reverse transcriptase domain-containing protein n=1 Tax=Streblomastix strix TaxID=222440 RepID=A0A5J4WDG0_9EUKA|nr:MAG: hypothetical protein EZS28_011744 [Streblomastix strix]
MQSNRSQYPSLNGQRNEIIHSTKQQTNYLNLPTSNQNQPSTPVNLTSNQQQINSISLQDCNQIPKYCCNNTDNHILTPIGARLLKFAEEWDKIGCGNLTRTGIQANWSYPDSTQYLESNKFIPQQRCSQIQDQALSNILETELREEIIDEVNERDLSWINPIFRKYKKEKKKRRKITDCQMLNKSLISDHFQMEDVHTLLEMIRPGDWTIKIDLESAFLHMLINENLKSFLKFTFHGRFYRYRAICFGIRHVPLTFHKTLRSIVPQKKLSSIQMRHLLR